MVLWCDLCVEAEKSEHMQNYLVFFLELMSCYREWKMFASGTTDSNTVMTSIFSVIRLGCNNQRS